MSTSPWLWGTTTVVGECGGQGRAGLTSPQHCLLTTNGLCAIWCLSTAATGFPCNGGRSGFLGTNVASAPLTLCWAIVCGLQCGGHTVTPLPLPHWLERQQLPNCICGHCPCPAPCPTSPTHCNTLTFRCIDVWIPQMCLCVEPVLDYRCPTFVNLSVYITPCAFFFIVEYDYKNCFKAFRLQF